MPKKYDQQSEEENYTLRDEFSGAEMPVHQDNSAAFQQAQELQQVANSTEETATSEEVTLKSHQFNTEIQGGKKPLVINNTVKDISLTGSKEQGYQLSFSIKGTTHKVFDWTLLKGNLRFEEIADKTLGNKSLNQADLGVLTERVVRSIYDQGNQIFTKISTISERLDKLKEKREAVDQDMDQLTHLGTGTGLRMGYNAYYKNTDRMGELAQKQLERNFKKTAAFKNNQDLIKAVQGGDMQSAQDQIIEQLQGELGTLTVDLLKTKEDLSGIVQTLSSPWLEEAFSVAGAEQQLELEPGRCIYDLEVRKPHLFSQSSTIRIERDAQDEMKLNTNISEKNEGGYKDFSLKSDVEWNAQKPEEMQNMHMKGRVNDGKEIHESSFDYTDVPEEGEASGSFSETTKKYGFWRDKPVSNTKGRFNLSSSEEEGTRLKSLQVENTEKKKRRELKFEDEEVLYTGYKKKDAAIALNSAQIGKEGFAVNVSFNRSKLEGSGLKGMVVRRIYRKAAKKVGKDYNDVPKAMEVNVHAKANAGWVKVEEIGVDVDKTKLNKDQKAIATEFENLIKAELQELQVRELDNGECGLFYRGKQVEDIPSEALRINEGSEIDMKAMTALVTDKVLGLISEAI